MYFLILLFTFPITAPTCSNDSPPQVPTYHLIEKCHRSTLGVISKANYTSLSSCRRLGIEKKGLALNFSPPEAAEDMKRNETVEFTCEVLKCAESNGGVSLVNDTRYDYYSIYAKHLPSRNSSCMPGVGMMAPLTPRLNYSRATEECTNMSGVLADLMSESRTDVFALLLAGAGVEMAYVGVSSVNGSEFVSVNGDTFDCTSYRAWAPGHPKRHRDKYGCVAITKTKLWLTVPCKLKLPFLCELSPSGPYGRRGRILASRNVNVTDVTPPLQTKPSKK